ncbi:glycosyltransferase [Agromyces binzhouensis]|uniref:Glycosyltransferase n=1 Tax=Agromyces binzhouensis TaxID=1817495 RepID=A0A4Q2JJW2_9MICO|nr:glycosyltransferase [Agromyces binzhouensis]RXZ46148.1 glycosyltransferase [Agromyces binzhouensis]
MPRFSILSTFPPTRCGLATFSRSLADALLAIGSDPIRIVRAVDDLDAPSPGLAAGIAVVGELHVDRPDRTQATARLLSAADVVIVQHEYGIYGGDDGSDVVAVLESLTSPSIVVLHTVLAAPTDGQRAVLERVVAAATAVVVMTEAARALLIRHFRVDVSRVSVIPHGVPEWTTPTAGHAGDRTTVLTWGLIGPSKGLEWGIRAIASLGDVAPAVHYEILGETHPKVVAHEGEAYRERLEHLADELGVADRVAFDSRYLDADALAGRVGAADLVLLPYDSRIQVTSGVLVEALAAGKPVIATGFPHARELLHPRMIVAHESPASIGAAVRAAIARAEPVEARPQGMSWTAVAGRFRSLADSLVAARVARSA